MTRGWLKLSVHVSWFLRNVPKTCTCRILSIICKNAQILWIPYEISCGILFLKKCVYMYVKNTDPLHSVKIPQYLCVRLR